MQEKAHKPAHLVDNAAELDPVWFAGMTRIGVTAGASTPTHITRHMTPARGSHVAPGPDRPLSMSPAGPLSGRHRAFTGWQA